MKVIKCTKYGPPEVLKLADVEKPEPKDNQVRIKIRSTAVTMSDIYVRTASGLPLFYRIMLRISLGITKPRNQIIGLILAGEIDSIGKDIKRFKPGDKVYSFAGFGMGAYAEYKCMPERDSKTGGCLTLMPKNVSYEEATSAAYGGLLALQTLEKGNVQDSKKALIYGASGTSGTTAIQVAKSFGGEVTGVCSEKNFELVKSLGADKMLDYRDNESIKKLEKYDLVMDAVGISKSSDLKEACKEALTPNGKYVSIDDGDLKMDSKLLKKVTKFVEEGRFKPVLDRSYDLQDIVEAHRYVEKGHKVGGVAVRVNHS